VNLLPKPAAVLPAALLLATLAGAPAAAFSIHAQQQIPMPAPPQSPAPTSTLILLDPAHGGPDTGAMFGDRLAEKDITLALAARLRTALLSTGFTVAATRDSDPADTLTTDQRAETANHIHPLACIVLHATATGSGVHIFTSTLPPPPPDDAANDTPPTFAPTLWNTAQTAFIPQSLSLATAVTAALSKDHLPALNAKAPLRPLDNLMCPAIAIEIAPLPSANDTATPVADAAYQQQVATSLAAALRTWRDRGTPAASAANLDSQIAAQSRAIDAAEAASHTATKPHPANAAPAAPQKAPQ
jgi:N-acetylmuramoyl-L-alanine amidase